MFQQVRAKLCIVRVEIAIVRPLHSLSLWTTIASASAYTSTRTGFGIIGSLVQVAIVVGGGGGGSLKNLDAWSRREKIAQVPWTSPSQRAYARY